MNRLRQRPFPCLSERLVNGGGRVRPFLHARRKAGKALASSELPSIKYHTVD